MNRASNTSCGLGGHATCLSPSRPREIRIELKELTLELNPALSDLVRHQHPTLVSPSRPVIYTSCDLMLFGQWTVRPAGSTALDILFAAAFCCDTLLYKIRGSFKLEYWFPRTQYAVLQLAISRKRETSRLLETTQHNITKRK